MLYLKRLERAATKDCGPVPFDPTKRNKTIFHRSTQSSVATQKIVGYMSFAAQISMRVSGNYWLLPIQAKIGFEFSEDSQKGEGPDFIGKINGKTVTVACVTFSGGDFEYDPKNALPVANYSSEIEYEEDGGYIGGQHLDQLRLRVAGAFKSKLEQREKN